MVSGGMMSSERLELMKLSKDSNISSLLVFLVSMMLISLVMAGPMFESDSIILHTWWKIMTTNSSDWLHSPPFDRENINIFNGSSHMKGDKK